MSIDSSVDDYEEEYLRCISLAQFYKHLRNALRTPDAAILRALLAEYPKLPIDSSFTSTVSVSTKYKLYKLLVQAPECVGLLLPRASHCLKIDLLVSAFHVQNESARFIIESGIELNTKSAIIENLCRRQDLFALHIALNANSVELQNLARTALSSGAVVADCLALIIQKGFDMREILFSDWKAQLSASWQWVYFSTSSAHCHQVFRKLLEPKLALVVLAGVFPATDLSRDSLSDTLVEWQQFAPRHFCFSQDCTVAYLKAQAAGLVRRFGTDVCIALQGLDLPALIVCEILQAHCAQWPLIPFHCYWNLAVAVKHFLTPTTQENKRRRV